MIYESLGKFGSRILLKTRYNDEEETLEAQVIDEDSGEIVLRAYEEGRKEEVS